MMHKSRLLTLIGNIHYGNDEGQQCDFKSKEMANLLKHKGRQLLGICVFPLRGTSTIFCKSDEGTVCKICILKMYESAIRLRHLLLCFESNSKGQILHQTAITFTVGILQLEGGKHHEMPKSEMNILKKDEDALLFMKYWGKKSLKCMKLAC